MLTIEDLLAVPILSTLPASALAEIVQTAADIHVGAGEYVAFEGEPPALFVVLVGLFEITKLLDGVERVVTERGAGQIYGEVPVIYGTQFLTNARAAQPSRILRIEMPRYYALATASPTFASALGALALNRLGGLQILLAEPPKVRGTLVGHAEDPAFAEIQGFLNRNQVPFEVLAPDANALPSWVQADVLRPEHLPAVRIGDGVVQARPSLRSLAKGFGLATAPRRTDYDVVIVGAGPSGLAAAVYGASEGLTTLVIEREAPGGQAGSSSRIENYLGFPGDVSGDDLAKRALRQAERLGAEVVVTRRAVSLDPASKAVALDGGDAVRAQSVILATGVSWRVLNLPGLDRLTGKGVHYGVARSEAAMTQGRDIHLVGAGNSAGQAALFLANHARSVTLLARGDDIGKTMSRYLIEQIRSKKNITVIEGAEIRAGHGDAHLTSLDIVHRSSGEFREVESHALFLFIGADADTGWLPSEIARDERGYILTGADLVGTRRWHLSRDPYLVETSVPGIFACGDVRLSRVKRVAAAVGEGSIAIAFVHEYLATQAEPGS